LVEIFCAIGLVGVQVPGSTGVVTIGVLAFAAVVVAFVAFDAFGAEAFAAFGADTFAGFGADAFAGFGGFDFVIVVFGGFGADGFVADTGAAASAMIAAAIAITMGMRRMVVTSRDGANARSLPVA